MRREYRIVYDIKYANIFTRKGWEIDVWHQTEKNNCFLLKREISDPDLIRFYELLDSNLEVVLTDKEIMQDLSAIYRLKPVLPKVGTFVCINENWLKEIGIEQYKIDKIKKLLIIHGLELNMRKTNKLQGWEYYE